MREGGLVAIGAAIGALLMILGMGMGKLAEERRGAAIALDNATLRESNKVLRRQCPSRPRLQVKAYLPGEMI